MATVTTHLIDDATPRGLIQGLLTVPDTNPRAEVQRRSSRRSHPLKRVSGVIKPTPRTVIQKFLNEDSVHTPFTAPEDEELRHGRRSTQSQLTAPKVGQDGHRGRSRRSDNVNYTSRRDSVNSNEPTPKTTISNYLNAVSVQTPFTAPPGSQYWTSPEETPEPSSQHSSQLDQDEHSSSIKSVPDEIQNDEAVTEEDVDSVVDSNTMTPATLLNYKRKSHISVDDFYQSMRNGVKTFPTEEQPVLSRFNRKRRHLSTAEFAVGVSARARQSTDKSEHSDVPVTRLASVSVTRDVHEDRSDPGDDSPAETVAFSQQDSSDDQSNVPVKLSRNAFSSRHENEMEVVHGAKLAARNFIQQSHVLSQSNLQKSAARKTREVEVPYHLFDKENLHKSHLLNRTFDKTPIKPAIPVGNKDLSPQISLDRKEASSRSNPRNLSSRKNISLRSSPRISSGGKHQSLQSSPQISSGRKHQSLRSSPQISSGRKHESLRSSPQISSGEKHQSLWSSPQISSGRKHESLRSSPRISLSKNDMSYLKSPRSALGRKDTSYMSNAQYPEEDVSEGPDLSVSASQNSRHRLTSPPDSTSRQSVLQSPHSIVPNASHRQRTLDLKSTVTTPQLFNSASRVSTSMTVGGEADSRADVIDRFAAEVDSEADIGDRLAAEDSVEASDDDDRSIHEIAYSLLKTPVLPPARATSTPIRMLKAPRDGQQPGIAEQNLVSRKVAPCRTRQAKNSSNLVGLPKALTKSIFTNFCKMRVSREAMNEVEKVSQTFWKTVSADLKAYTIHSGRQTVEEADVELLMKRQGLLGKKQGLYSLVSKYLPMEYQQEIIPMTTAGNMVVPRK